jgi:DNA-binding FadR family transcriptional regulator
MCARKAAERISDADANELRRIGNEMEEFQFRLARQPGRADVSLPQHRAIIDAVCRHDPDGAAETMRLHLESVADAIRAANT